MVPAVDPDIPIGPLAERVAAALGDDLVGLYLYGSAVSGGFEPGVSDVDLVAVTLREVVQLDLAGLDRVHRAFVADYPESENRLEVIYIGAPTLGDFRTSRNDLAVVSPGEAFHRSGPARDWYQNWYLLRETGVTLRGSDVRDVVPEISRAEFLEAVATYAQWLAAQDLEALPPGALAYAVLAECRALLTVHTGLPCSKQAAAEWVAQRAPERAEIIEAALTCRLSGGRTGFADPDLRASASAFVRTIAERIGGRERR
jgi:hypothetical protein